MRRNPLVAPVVELHDLTHIAVTGAYDEAPTYYNAVCSCRWVGLTTRDFTLARADHSSHRRTERERACQLRGPHVEGPGCSLAYRGHITPEACGTCGDTGRVSKIVGGQTQAQDCPDCSGGAW